MNTNTLTITLVNVRAHQACEPSFTLMREALGPGWNLNDPLPLSRVLEVRGVEDTLWALRCVPTKQADEKRRVVSLWLADILERVEDKMGDERSRAIIPLLREHAINPVSSARWRDAYTLANAANAAAYAYTLANAAAYAAAYAATYAAAYAAAYAATYAAAYAATYAAYAAANYAAEREWQTQRLRFYLTGEQP